MRTEKRDERLILVNRITIHGYCIYTIWSLMDLFTASQKHTDNLNLTMYTTKPPQIWKTGTARERAAKSKIGACSHLNKFHRSFCKCPRDMAQVSDSKTAGHKNFVNILYNIILIFFCSWPACSANFISSSAAKCILVNYCGRTTSLFLEK